MEYNVFLVEDVEATRALIRLLLGDSAYRVVGEAGSVASALEKLANTKVDMVILDLELPDGNGIDVVPNIREMHPDAVIVVASAHNDANSVQSALQLGAQGYLIKPFTPGALENALARALRRAGRTVPAQHFSH